ncbi:MAG: Jag N-terminal domain-containing protein [Elusimicrobia bacterium]|nr:Jag N-terminal domain-containing protein [Elusimicrobiota bacterium]
MKELKAEGKTIQDAIDNGLKKLSLRRDQVEIVIVKEGKKGIIGIGSKKASIILTEKKWKGSDETQTITKPTKQNKPAIEKKQPARNYNFKPKNSKPISQNNTNNSDDADNTNKTPAFQPQQAQTADVISNAKSILSQMLSLMGISFNITEANYDRKTDKILIKFDSEDSSLFVNRNGTGIESIQYLVNAIINRTMKPHTPVQIDTANYWERREKDILKIIEHAAKAVQQTAKPFRLDPMSAPQRKFVHGIIKKDYPKLKTASEGDGRWRKIVIKPAGN